MDVVGHNDEGVECEAAFGSLILKSVDEEQGVAFDLEEASPGGGDRGDEVCADFLRRQRLGWRIQGPGLKPH